MNKIILVLLLSLLLCQCKTQSYSPDSYEEAMIVIGTGGGFTGQLEEYCLLSNGQLFRRKNQQSYENELTPLGKNETQQIFNTYRQMKFDTLDIDKPGNMYHYFIYRKKGLEHKIQWGAYDANTPKELTIHFANLKKLFTNRKSIKFPNQ